MICCRFILRPGTCDDDFHRLDGEIHDYAHLDASLTTAYGSAH